MLHGFSSDACLFERNVRHRDDQEAEKESAEPRGAGKYGLGVEEACSLEANVADWTVLRV